MVYLEPSFCNYALSKCCLKTQGKAFEPRNYADGALNTTGTGAKRAPRIHTNWFTSAPELKEPILEKNISDNKTQMEGLAAQVGT